MATNPYAKYQEQSVMTMTHGEMLVKLYDGAVRQIRLAMVAVEQKNHPASNEAFQKAQRIVEYLRVTLDLKYDISQELLQFYNFFSEKLIEANIRKNVDGMQEIIDLILELRDAFDQSDRLARMEKQTASNIAQGR